MCNNIRSKLIILYLLLGCLLSVLVTSKTIASNDTSYKTSNSISAKVTSSGPYCGLYCLYTIMKMTGKEVEFRELLKPEYMRSNAGSSLAELKKAAKNNGIYAEPVGKLTSQLLLNYSNIILHVKSSSDSKKYDHYVLYLGTQNDRATIFDPPNPVKLVTFAELTPLWDGYGLIVSSEPIDLNPILASARKRLSLYASIMIIGILILHLIKRFIPVTLYDSRIKRIGLSVGQAGGFAIAALFVGMFYHFVHDEGFLAKANATATIQEAHKDNFIPKISDVKVKQLLGTDTIFIDARLAYDYELGHLDGAISIPVDSNDVERHQATTGINKDARIVMYCQSSGCQYAEKVAIKLKEDGFTNISIYKGGWMDWKEKNIKEENHHEFKIK